MTRNRVVSAIAHESTDLLVLRRDDFLSVAQQYDAVSAYFRELIGARFRSAVNQPLVREQRAKPLLTNL